MPVVCVLIAKARRQRVGERAWRRAGRYRGNLRYVFSYKGGGMYVCLCDTSKHLLT